MVLHSWKWTWTPVLLMFDTAKTNTYSQHVLLCADYNKRNALGHDDPRYLRPYTTKEFYRILGLKMMKYRAETGYFCESEASQAKAKRSRDAAATAAASTRRSSNSQATPLPKSLALFDTVLCCAQALAPLRPSLPVAQRLRTGRSVRP
jgi:hypothetical protein